MDHKPGRLDFLIEEKDFTVTAFRRKPSAVWAFVETPGHIAFFTRRGKRICALTSIETHACLSGNYEAEIAEVERISREYREERRAAGRIKQNGAEDICLVAGRKEPDFFKCPEDAELISVHENVRRSIECATEIISVELDEVLKVKAEAVMSAIGWTLEETLILFLYWCVSDPDRAESWAKAHPEGEKK